VTLASDVTLPVVSAGTPSAATVPAIRVLADGRDELVPVPGGAWATLLDALRAAGRTEVKEACREGRCGACAVLIDGELRLSCLVLAARASGAAVTTAASPACGAASAAVAACGAVQCGYCTPGVVVSLTWAGAEGVSAEEALAATICRCGCHPGFRRAASALGLAVTPATGADLAADLDGAVGEGARG
jgi:carbon-monoxide dehydrogenase small subunit